MIEALGLHKRYGDHEAVRDVSLTVPAGRILGVLGPNGAGKSTTVRMLTTMTRPDAGHGHVGGLDIVDEAAAVRRIIGVTGQDASLDELPHRHQNLVMVGELSRLPRRQARARAVELLDRFDLDRRRRAPGQDLLRGMRRRLDLAASLVTRPPVLFLDEPTTGLDPTSRLRMWDVIRELVATAPPCCSPPSTSTRPTPWPTPSRSSTGARSSPRAPPASSRPASAASSSRSP
jgi:ABC-type multidrug transport system ATPase subunit